MMEHTSGPWRVCPLDFRAVEGPDGLVIADVRSAPSQHGREDARLIAAAPDLLEALKEAYSVLVDEDKPLAHYDIAVKWREAIAKAEGR